MWPKTSRSFQYFFLSNYDLLKRRVASSRSSSSWLTRWTSSDLSSNPRPDMQLKYFLPPTCPFGARLEDPVTGRCISRPTQTPVENLTEPTNLMVPMYPLCDAARDPMVSVVTWPFRFDWASCSDSLCLRASESDCWSWAFSFFFDSRFSSPVDKAVESSLCWAASWEDSTERRACLMADWRLLVNSTSVKVMSLTRDVTAVSLSPSIKEVDKAFVQVCAALVVSASCLTDWSSWSLVLFSSAWMIALSRASLLTFDRASSSSDSRFATAFSKPWIWFCEQGNLTKKGKEVAKTWDQKGPLRRNIKEKRKVIEPYCNIIEFKPNTLSCNLHVWCLSAAETDTPLANFSFYLFFCSLPARPAKVSTLFCTTCK